MPSVSSLLFDFGGTLDLPGGHWLDRFLVRYRAAGLELSRAEMDAAYSHATAAAYRLSDTMREAGLSDLLRFLVRAQFDYLGRSGPGRLREALEGGEDEELIAAISAGFVEETRRGLSHSREVLAALSSRFKLAVVSNFYGNLERVLAEAEMLELMSAVVDSSRVGFFKPDPRIIQAALALIGAAPEKAAMIGDSLEKDCAPARRMGLRTVWLRGARGAQAESASLASADYTIGGLDELADLAW